MVKNAPEQVAPSDLSWSNVREVIASVPPSARIGVAIRDHQSGERFDHHGVESFRSASTTKLLILLELGNQVAARATSLTERISIDPAKKVAGSGVLNWLDSANELSVHDLAWLMIAISDNTASNVLIDHVTLSSIARLQAELDLHGTQLTRHFMKPIPGQPGNFATAVDLVTILDAIAGHPSESGWMMSMLADQQVQDRLGRYVPQRVEFAGKSGWQEGISHDSGTLTSSRGAATVAVLTENFVSPYDAAEFIGNVGNAIVTDLALAPRSAGQEDRS